MRHWFFSLAISTILSCVAADAAAAVITGCEAESAQYCGNVVRGHGGLYRCLQDHRASLGLACKESLVRASVTAQWIGEYSARAEAVRLAIELAVMAALFAALERWRPAVRERRFWRPGLGLDLAYALLNALVIWPVSAYLVLCTALGSARYLSADLALRMVDGWGPLVGAPLAFRALFFLLVSDGLGYCLHRLFHTRWLWRLHAVHHSSDPVDWLSNQRHHPAAALIDAYFQTLIFVALGFPFRDLGFLIPIRLFLDYFGHANLAFSGGQLGRWIVMPAFHRRHHLKNAEEHHRNFASNFVFWDRLFGTYSAGPAPADCAYGLGEPTDPGLAAQLLSPFRRAERRR